MDLRGMTIAEISPPQAPLKTPAVKENSCLRCSQRKVKCDKNNPCSNCKKGQIECTYVVPSRRKKRKLPEEDLVGRLKRYEELLKDHGVEFDPYDGADQARTASSDRMVVRLEGSRSRDESFPTLQSGKMILEQGTPRYVENHLWTGLTDGFRGPKDVMHPSSNDGLATSHNPIAAEVASFDEGGLVFGSSSAATSLTSLHPQPVHIFRLWQTFLDNVNPLSKILHAPTTQQLILEIAGDLDNVSKGVEALLFAIYAAATGSLSNLECENMFGEARSTLLARYRLGTQQALIRAEFLRSSQLMILQAFVIFLLSARQYYDHRSLWAFSGLAVRIGQRLGLHRDGTSLGLPIFETEMRRRLWWQIVILDSRSAELSGSGTSVLAHLWDTKSPLNVNDSDLSLDMREPPLEHARLTEMVFCMVRSKIGSFMRHPDSLSTFELGLRGSGNVAASLRKKDKIIDELEEALEREFVRYCDPMIPLHVLVTCVARCAVCKLRLIAHHPRQYPEGPKSMPQSEREMLFSNSLRMIEQDNVIHFNKSTQRFLWHISAYFQLEALAYLLNELRQRTTGELVERAWREIDKVFEHHSEILASKDNALFVAIQDIAVKAWEARAMAYVRHKGGVPRPPHFISDLMHPKKQIANAPSTAAKVDNGSLMPHPCSSTQARGVDLSEPSSESYFSDIANGFGLSVFLDSKQAELNPMDWAYWDDLLKGSDFQTFDGAV